MTRVAIIGGGAAGASLAWCLANSDHRGEVTIFHDEDEVGGHSRTIPVAFDDRGRGYVPGPDEAPRQTYPVDIGVQFVCPSLYPNLYRQLERPEMRAVTLVRHRELKMSGAFRDDLNWGNFAEYQRGPRFEKCFDSAARTDALRFQRDIARAPWGRVGGRRIISLSVGDYLDAAGISRSGNFFRYFLIPYLCIINGYGTVDLLQTTMEDLFPIFTRLPLVQDEGPYGSFTEVGRGWDRFEFGATQWVTAMAEVARNRGAKINVASPVERIERRGSEWIVRFTTGATYGKGGRPLARGTEKHEAAFDVVVLTTDMTTNRELLAHDDNPLWSRQRSLISPESFALLPGACYIHQDEQVLAPSLRDEKEDGQFTGYFAWGKRDAGSDFYDLPYDLGEAFQTYSMQNILGTPHRCFVSMYAEDRTSVVPAKDKTIFVRTWRHGRWVASFFREAKKTLHTIQGLENLWFAGNNTTVDSEEGALISGMVIASRIAGYRYPFSRISSAWLLYSYFEQMMFPSRSRSEGFLRAIFAR